jgi:uncharacterized protein YkwD
LARKAIALALLVLGTAIGLQGAQPAAAGATACPFADTPSAQLAVSQFDDSVFCLINEERAANGARHLRPNPLLWRGASGYTNSLLRGRFFSHHGDFAGHPSVMGPVGRLRQIGYVRRGYVWFGGEDLRWSTPETSSPADIVGMWMNSPIHRYYLLKPKFDEVGVAGASGTPFDPSLPDGITVAVEFGFRRPR